MNTIEAIAAAAEFFKGDHYRNYDHESIAAARSIVNLAAVNTVMVTAAAAQRVMRLLDSGMIVLFERESTHTFYVITVNDMGTFEVVSDESIDNHWYVDRLYAAAQFNACMKFIESLLDHAYTYRSMSAQRSSESITVEFITSDDSSALESLTDYVYVAGNVITLVNGDHEVKFQRDYVSAESFVIALYDSNDVTAWSTSNYSADEYSEVAAHIERLIMLGYKPLLQVAY